MVNFLFCSTPADSAYKYVPRELSPACCRIGHLVCLKRTSMTNEDILKTVLQKGAQLKREQVEKCLASCGIPYPTEGSGESSRVLKPDLMDALLQHFFPDEAHAELSRMRQRLAKMMPRTMLRRNVRWNCCVFSSQWIWRTGITSGT